MDSCNKNLFEDKHSSYLWHEMKLGINHYLDDVQVKKEEKNIRRTVLNSVVGTLDLSIRLLFRGETYPGVCK